MVSSIVVAQPFVEKGDIRQIALFQAAVSRRCLISRQSRKPFSAQAMTAGSPSSRLRATPAEPVARMNKAIGEFLKPDTQERLHKIGLASRAPARRTKCRPIFARGRSSGRRWRRNWVSRRNRETSPFMPRSFAERSISRREGRSGRVSSVLQPVSRPEHPPHRREA